MPKTSELQFGLVRVVGRGVPVLDGDPRLATGGEVLGGFSSFSPWQMPLGRRRWNVSDSYAKTWQYFRSANVSLESSFRGLFGDIIGFNVNVGIYEKLAKNSDYSTKTQMQAVNCCCPCCDDSRCRRRQAPCIFMNARYGAVLHRPRPGQPAATRPCLQITLSRLVWRFYTVQLELTLCRPLVVHSSFSATHTGDGDLVVSLCMAYIVLSGRWRRLLTFIVYIQNSFSATQITLSWVWCFDTSQYSLQNTHSSDELSFSHVASCRHIVRSSMWCTGSGVVRRTADCRTWPNYWYNWLHIYDDADAQLLLCTEPLAAYSSIEFNSYFSNFLAY